jgi:hypothetical protein
MQTIKAYLYDQKVEVQILDTAIFTVRNRQVYSHPIKVYQGIDNPIQVVIKNQDQKKANVSTYRVQVDIQDFTNNVTVWSGNVNFDANLGGNIQQGRGVITITSATLANLEQRLYNLTTRTISNTNVQRPVYIDDNHGAVLDLEVLPGYLNP